MTYRARAGLEGSVLLDDCWVRRDDDGQMREQENRIFTVFLAGGRTLSLTGDEARELQGRVEALDSKLGERMAQAFNHPDPAWRFDGTADADSAVIAPIVDERGLGA
jgi:hypothetical protein